ncbi:hypothetical protein YC2023_026708 [Brassica napus]
MACDQIRESNRTIKIYIIGCNKRPISKMKWGPSSTCVERTSGVIRSMFRVESTNTRVDEGSHINDHIRQFHNHSCPHTKCPKFHGSTNLNSNDDSPRDLTSENNLVCTTSTTGKPAGNRITNNEPTISCVSTSESINDSSRSHPIPYATNTEKRLHTHQNHHSSESFNRPTTRFHPLHQTTIPTHITLP